MRPMSTQLELSVLSVYQSPICVHEREQSSLEISACDLVFTEEPQSQGLLLSGYTQWLGEC